jgi:SAM-dependent methyltransferase
MTRLMLDLEASAAARLPGRALRWLRRILFDPTGRYAQRVQNGRVRGGFQPNNATWDDRYPRIFDFVRSRFPEDGRPLRFLSFGCSTGEEVFSLRRRFPEASVRGLDINPGAIRACHERLSERADPAVSFARAGSPEGEPASSYDAIFCMAVLRDSRLSEREVADCSRFIRFEDFASLVSDFHRCLTPGGLLVLIHSNFRLCDTPVGPAFEVLFSRQLPPHAASPIYGPDNRLARGLTNPDTVFRKIGAGAA